MNEKNIPDDIDLKSLNELTELADKIIKNLENEKDLGKSTEEYQELIKLNNYIEKKFQQETKSISRKTKYKIDQITSYGKKTKKTIQKS